jgi:mannonate dehydratase
MVSAEAYRRLINIAPSLSNGVTFCQGNFKAMGEDSLEGIQRGSAKGRRVA